MKKCPKKFKWNNCFFSSFHMNYSSMNHLNEQKCNKNNIQAEGEL